MRKPRMSGEEWKAIASKLHREGWLRHSYDPKNGKQYWRATKWGERHYQKACQLVDADKLFSGNTLKELKKTNLSYAGLTNQHLYKLNLITEVFDDSHLKDTNELTREGYEWFYAYTKLKNKKTKSYQGQGNLARMAETILFAIYVLIYIIAKRLSEKGSVAKPSKRKRR